MKARSAARELALIALFQRAAGDNSAVMDKGSVQERVLGAVRSLVAMATDQMHSVAEDIAVLTNQLQDWELAHPDNEEVRLSEPTQAVPIPTNRGMIDQLNNLLAGVDTLHNAFALAEIQVLSQREEVQNYCWMLIRLLQVHQSEIDTMIDTVATDWRVERLQKMDLALLRLAIVELLYAEQVDKATVVNECLELAHRYTSEESRKFIHGILGRVAEGKSLVEPQPAEESETETTHV